MERTSHLPEFLWILCDDRQDEPSHVLTDAATIGRYLARGGRVGAKQNNIQLRILRELPILPKDELMRELRDFLTM